MNCNKGNYFFTIINNYLSGISLDNITGQFKLKIFNFEKEVFCSINNKNRIIICNAMLTEENEYCLNINKDIKIENIIGEYYILINNSILHLNGFENLETFTIEAGI